MQNFSCEIEKKAERCRRVQIRGVRKYPFVPAGAEVLCGVLNEEQQCGTHAMKSQPHHMTSLPSCVGSTGLPLIAPHRFLEMTSEFVFVFYLFTFESVYIQFRKMDVRNEQTSDL